MSYDPIEELYQRAQQHGVAMSRICDQARVARSTPSRWRHDKNGASHRILRRLNVALDEILGAETILSRPVTCSVCAGRLDDVTVRSCRSTDCPHAVKEAA